MPSCPLSTLFFTSTHNILYNMQITGTQEIRDRPPFFFNVVVLPFLLTHTWLVKYLQNTGIIFWFVYRMKALFQTHQIHSLKGEMFQIKLMEDDCLFPAAHKSGCSAISNIPGKEAGDFLSMFWRSFGFFTAFVLDCTALTLYTFEKEIKYNIPVCLWRTDLDPVGALYATVV